MHFYVDPALIAVIDRVRELHAPIDEAISHHTPVAATDFAALSGAVGHLLYAIDARTLPASAPVVKAVA
ncbi:hypothetical protein [Streptomyces sp. NPDC101249]|uniref:hypothetical protein n=1 Tax=Streptomyces sp. NPDC101249 TaxID=3366140 RepID=UPI0038155205